MRKSTFASWALAAVMAVALSSAQSARAAASNASLTKMLSSELPGGETLAHASVDDTAKALGAAAHDHPELATSLTQTAVEAKSTKRGKISCANLIRLVGAATAAVPSASSDIVQTVLSMHPECADQLNALVNSPGNGPDGYNTPQDLYGGFGIGFGPGFPGSPGFTGSPPSGAIALPPTVVTNDRNG